MTGDEITARRSSRGARRGARPARSAQPIAGPTIEAGYNVFRDADEERTAVPLDTPIPVPLRADPKVQTMNCEVLCIMGTTDFPCPALVAELPSDGTLECHPSSTLWSRTRCDGCSCLTEHCSYEVPCPAP